MLPETIDHVAQLEELLSEPSPGAIAALGRMQGDLLLLGVGGKMGPTLARMAKRASDLAGKPRRVMGVARFSSNEVERELQSVGVETIKCDLLDRDQLGRLPDCPNVLFMTGFKFGSSGQAGLTWAMNCLLPAFVCERFSRSRIVAFSTGNVYGLSPVSLGGSVETDPLAPVGEYAMSCLGRERMFEYFSQSRQLPVTILRLNYATELRYGVLVDIAQKVLAGEPVDLAMGHLNAIWQADANAMALEAFDHVASPACVWNLAGPELLSVRRIALQFGELFQKPVQFTGTEGAEALLNNGQLVHRLCGYPRVGVQQMVGWIAHWLKNNGTTLNKPTHFESREGKF